jgi:integrase
MPRVDNTTNRVKFVAGRVRDFQCPKGQPEALLWDTDEKTLCLRARESGHKSYYYQSRYAGKVIKIKIGNFTDTNMSFEKARIVAREYETQIDKGHDPRQVIREETAKSEAIRVEEEKGKVKFKQVWDEYVNENSLDWSELHLKDHHKAMQSGGRKRKRSSVKTVAGVLYGFRAVRLAEFTPDMIVKWMGKEKQKRPTVAARGYRLLRACLNWADGEERYQDTVNVDRLFKNQKIRKALPVSKPKQDALEGQHLPLWFKAVQSIGNPVIAAYLQGLLITGARREELAGLTWEDLDFQWNSIRIKDKVEGERVIPLTPYLAYLLQSLPRRNEWVFSSPQAKSGRLQDPYRNHANALALAGLPPISLHGLRRSFGSLSEWVECPVGIVAQIQGHKPSATAEKHYRVRPLDLLRLWHTKIEKKILQFGGLEQPKKMHGEVGLSLKLV